MDDMGFDAVQRQIRDAEARGEFDNLPGAGKPLKLGGTQDPDWWIKGLAEREQLDLSAAMPSAAQLRKEAESYPESLADVRREATVREILEDFNQRVKQDRLRPVLGSDIQIIAPTVEVDAMVEQWAALRRQRAAGRRTTAEQPSPGSTPRTPRRWWRRSPK